MRRGAGAGAARRPAQTIPKADVRGAQAADREGRQPAHAAPGALRRAGRGDLPRQHRQVPQGDRRRGEVDFVGWEDIRQQTAVAANTGAGPDIIIGWAEDPHIYADKVIELTDLAEYLGKKYGGWMFLGEKYGKKAKTNNWIGLPMGGVERPDLVYRKSAVKEAGFDEHSRTTMPASSSSARS